MDSTLAEPIPGQDTQQIAPEHAPEVNAEEKPAEVVAQAARAEETAMETANEPHSGPTTRRSTRISSQPQPKEPAKSKKAAAPKNQKKRTADEANPENGDAEKDGAHKKVRWFIYSRKLQLI